MSTDEREERERPADILTANKLTEAIDRSIEDAAKLPPAERAEVLATLATALKRVQKGIFHRRKGSAIMTKAMAYHRSR